MKIKVYRAEQSMWGKPTPTIRYFRTENELDDYCLFNEYSTKLAPVMVDSWDINKDNPFAPYSFYSDIVAAAKREEMELKEREEQDRLEYERAVKNGEAW